MFSKIFQKKISTQKIGVIYQYNLYKLTKLYI